MRRPSRWRSDRSHLLKRGQVLRVGMVEGSSTAYLAVAGGFALPPFMGSLSTYARAGIGGFEGRKLAAGDALPLKLDQAPAGDERKLGAPFDYGSGPIRVVWGPQDDYFSEAGRQTFVTSEYRVSKEADRMGIRFEGPTIEHSKGADIISDGIGPGAIQVPGAGLPIVLLADRQTVGGYSKIATVASVDLPRLGRLLPGRTVRFAAVTVEEAEALRREQEARLARAIANFQVARPGRRHRPRAALRREPDRRHRLRARGRRAIGLDVEALVGRGRHEIAREQVELRVGRH